MNPIEDVGPAFEGDAAEDGEHGLENIVESSHSIVGSDPTIQAHKTVQTLTTQATRLGIEDKFFGDVVVAGSVEDSREELKTNDGVDEDDEKDEESNMEEGDHRLED